MKEFIRDAFANWKIRIGVAVIFFLIGFISYKILTAPRVNSNQIVSIPTTIPNVVPFQVPEELKNVDAFNVLLLGYGGAGHDGGYLTDVIILMHVNFKKNTVALVSIPRDLWVTLPSGKQGKINAAFISEDSPQYPTENVSLDEALEGAVKTKSVIETVSGLTPHFFVGIDFNSFISVIDKLGGVDVDVPEAFEDPWYPVKGRELELCGLSPEEITEIHQQYSGFELEKQFACRYEKLSFKKGTVHMNGETTLKFVRSRHSATGGGDFSRSKRQQAVLVGVRDGLLSKNILNDPVGLYKAYQKSVQTNLTENLVKNIVPLLSNGGNYKVVQISLNTENVLQDAKSSSGAFILAPQGGDWESVQQYIAEQIK